MQVTEHAIRNTYLDVVIRPGEGGRVASLRCRGSGLEFLTQSGRTRIRLEPGLHARFQDGAAAGIEECLPTVGPCGNETVGGAVPDHGDFWQLAWRVISSTDTELCVEAEGFSRPLRFRKDFSLAGSKLSIHYKVTNLGASELSVLYACHPLFAIEAGDRICLPDEVSRVLVDYSRGERIGTKGTCVPWPVAAPGVALDEAIAYDSDFAEMLYTNRLTQGSCGIYRSSQRQGLAVRFNPAELPNLGIWLCYGGWPDDTERSRQYAVALEPTFAPVNTLKEAQETGRAKSLRPAECATWSIAFEVSEPQCSLDDFRSWMLGTTQ
jgi:galactose mutarotase-like enzyme